MGYAQRKQRPKGYYYSYSYTTSKMFSSNTNSMLFDEGFVRSASMILASEIGDKTFFIAAVMAMTHSRATVWSGSVFALAVMTALSALLGAVAPNVLNKTTTHYIATGLFFLFGARSIYEQTIGYDANSESELEEVEKALSKTSQRRRSTRQSSTKTSAAA